MDKKIKFRQLIGRVQEPFNVPIPCKINSQADKLAADQNGSIKPTVNENEPPPFMWRTESNWCKLDETLVTACSPSYA